MKCENCFCVYWKQNTCILAEISLDIKGCCRECVYINVEEKALLEARARLLAAWDYE